MKKNFKTQVYFRITASIKLCFDQAKCSVPVDTGVLDVCVLTLDCERKWIYNFCGQRANLVELWFAWEMEYKILYVSAFLCGNLWHCSMTMWSVNVLGHIHSCSGVCIFTYSQLFWGACILWVAGCTCLVWSKATGLVGSSVYKSLTLNPGLFHWWFRRAGNQQCLLSFWICWACISHID